MFNVIRSDENVWPRKPAGAQANFREGTCARRDDGPPLRRQGAQDFNRAGPRDDAIQIREFSSLDFAIFQFIIRAWQVIANRRNAWSAMRGAHDFLRVESVLDGPLAPHASDGMSGIQQHAIHIEQHSRAGDLDFVTCQQPLPREPMLRLISAE